MYKVFVRNWYRIENGNRVPDPTARKTTIANVSSEEDAIELCSRYNSTHKAGKLSRKAEFIKIR